VDGERAAVGVGDDEVGAVQREPVAGRGELGGEPLHSRASAVMRTQAGSRGLT
jgi:hypothetical protein